MPSTLRMFTTIAGNEIIGELVEKTDTTLTLQYPLYIKAVDNQQTNQYQLVFIPYSLTATDGRHTFNRNIIQSESVGVPHDLETNYKSQVSGIQIVSSVGNIKG